MKIYLQESTLKGTEFNAGSKARQDCDEILEQKGYSRCSMYVSDSRLLCQLLRFYNMVVVLLKLRKASICFLQYPYYSYLRFGEMFYRILFGFYSGKVECLIHDILWYREEKKIEPALRYLLKKCDTVIVHTPKMKELLINKLLILPSKIKVLYLFDYLTEVSPLPANISGNQIIFAGNLLKSLFLSQLGNLPADLVFHVYGLYSDKLVESPCCIYKGKFSPENISAIEGHWGLVWDGDQLDTCHGNYGEYLKINSSHKISLYLAACKPVIVWDGSSLSNFIVENKLGISVHSLFEISYRLSLLTVQDKRNIEMSVVNFSQYLRKGKMLSDCLC